MKNFFKDTVAEEVKEVEFTCSKHGKQKATKVLYNGNWIGGKCELCEEEKKNNLEVKQQEILRKNEQEDKRKLMEKNFETALIPLRFQKHCFTSYEPKDKHQEKIKKACIDYTKNFDEAMSTGRCLIFCGRTGTGKTHLSCAIANNILKKGKTALFMSVIDAVRRVKETYSRNSLLTERQAIESFVEPSLLILDEVGIQFGSEAEKMIIFEIINKRYENIKPTILITNLEPEELKSYIGDRVVDRLRENGGVLFHLNWDSHRKAAKY